jgi:hypothetical protein
MKGFFLWDLLLRSVLSVELFVNDFEKVYSFLF